MNSKVYLPVTEDIAFGQLVSFGVGGASLAVYPGNKCRAFCSKASENGYAEFQLFGMYPEINGLTPGDVYYLTATPGALGVSPGANAQAIGYAVTDKNLFFLPQLL